MLDMSSVIIAKSDQINAADLIGVSRTVKIAGVKLTGKEQATEIRIADDQKVWRPNKNTVRIMSRAWGNDGEKWIGRSVTLYCDPKVKFGKDEPGGIRISHLSGLRDKLTVCLQERKGVLKTYEIEPLVVQEQPRDAAPATPDDERAKYEGWTERTLTAIGGAMDSAALAKIDSPARRYSLERMRADFPDLADRIDAAFAARLAELEGV